MNIVAHEYIASRVDEDGVLILSEFAGAAKHLKDAILVNPYDVSSVTDAIERALNMDREETRRRMRSLRSEVMRLDVHRWADNFIEALESP
jgi:trehalose-6-phosphate synthase